MGVYNDPLMAGNCESAFIRYFASINNKLCNSDCNPAYNRIINCIPIMPLNKKRRPFNYANNVCSSAMQEFKDKLKYNV